MDGALVGSYFGGAHGAVAGAIIGTIVGSAAEDNYYYDRRVRVRDYGREYGRYEPAPTYYAPPVAAYQPYYEPSYDVQYAPRQVVYVQPPEYNYPYAYASYSSPVYYGRYASPRYISHGGHYGSRHDQYNHRGHYGPRHDRHDHRGRY